MKRKEKIKMYLNFLNHCYETCKKDGSISGLYSLANEFGISNGNITKAISECNILKRENRRVWVWTSTSKPNRIMVNDLLNKITDIGRIQNNKYMNSKDKKSHNLVSFSEIERKAEIHARNKLIKACQSANIVGINLIEQPEEIINKFVTSVTKE